ncbi:MAG TPA: zinc ribbon domain-containing protein [Polyangiaceae bacterium]
MPTYEYGCASCGSEWEEVQRITEPPLEVCPTCGKSSAHRLISRGAGFILKGGGWYSDLYSSAKPAGNKEESKSTTSSDAPSSPSSSEGSSGKSETSSGKSSDGSPGKSESKAASAVPSTTSTPATPTSSS